MSIPARIARLVSVACLVLGLSSLDPALGQSTSPDNSDSVQKSYDDSTPPSPAPAASPEASAAPDSSTCAGGDSTRGPDPASVETSPSSTDALQPQLLGVAPGAVSTSALHADSSPPTRETTDGDLQVDRSVATFARWATANPSLALVNSEPAALGPNSMFLELSTGNPLGGWWVGATRHFTMDPSLPVRASTVTVAVDVAANGETAPTSGLTVDGFDPIQAVVTNGEIARGGVLAYLSRDIGPLSGDVKMPADAQQAELLFDNLYGSAARAGLEFQPRPVDRVYDLLSDGTPKAYYAIGQREIPAANGVPVLVTVASGVSQDDGHLRAIQIIGTGSLASVVR